MSIVTGFWILVFVVSLFVLVKAADYFTDSSEELGLYLGMPPFLVGVTIVAIGTSLPEILSSVVSVVKGSSEFVVGNVAGSNITNIFLILGLAAIAGKRLKVGYELVRVDLPLLIGSAFVLAFVVYDGIITLVESLVCLAGMLLYVVYAAHTHKKREHHQKDLKKKIKKELKEEQRKLDNKDIFILVGSAIFIYIGARYTVESVVHLSEVLSIGKEVLAASAVALGTSLPELAVSVKAAQKGSAEIAVGNILGSNIFNVFAVIGASGLFGAIFVPADIVLFALPVMLVATLLYFFTAQDKEITAWEGWIFILFYVLYLGKLFVVF